MNIHQLPIMFCKFMKVDLKSLEHRTRLLGGIQLLFTDVTSISQNLAQLIEPLLQSICISHSKMVTVTETQFELDTMKTRHGPCSLSKLGIPHTILVGNSLSLPWLVSWSMFHKVREKKITMFIMRRLMLAQ